MVTGVQMMIAVLINVIEDIKLVQKVTEGKNFASKGKMMVLKQEK
jgi:hypothetical protein